MVRRPFSARRLLELLSVLEDLGPFLLAVLLEEAGVEGDAARNLTFCSRAVLVADLERIRHHFSRDPDVRSEG